MRAGRAWVPRAGMTEGSPGCPQEAQKYIATAKRDIKMTSKELNQQLADMEELLNANLRRAERENSTVYLQRVPNIADLPAIQAFPVAK